MPQFYVSLVRTCGTWEIVCASSEIRGLFTEPLATTFCEKATLRDPLSPPIWPLKQDAGERGTFYHEESGLYRNGTPEKWAFSPSSKTKPRTISQRCCLNKKWLPYFEAWRWFWRIFWIHGKMQTFRLNHFQA